MASSTVKCSNCNVVINELLAFLSNVLDYMDEDSIHQLVTSSFNVETISQAKCLLFESVPNARKMPVRRKDGKKRMSRDLDDIICLMKGMDAEVFPVFVAKDLHKVPSVSFDHIDCTRLLKDISKLRIEISLLQENVVTKEMLEAFKKDLRHASIITDNYPSQEQFVNKRRGACLQESYYEMCSGPIGLQYVPIKANNASSSSSSGAKHHSTPTKSESSPASAQPISFQREQSNGMVTNASRHVEARTGVLNNASESSNGSSPRHGGESGMAVAAGGEALPRGTVVSNAPDSERDCARASVNKSVISPSLNSQTAVSTVLPPLLLNKNVSQGAKNCSQVTKENSEWQVVQSKSARRYKLIGQKGRATTAPDGKFKAADIKVPLFISNVSKDTCEQDIVSYIQDKTGEVVSLKIIKMKTNRKYNADISYLLLRVICICF